MGDNCIPVPIEGFSKQSIFVKPRSGFSYAAKLLVNGNDQSSLRTPSGKGYSYFVPDDSGNKVEFHIQNKFFDPIPELTVSGKKIVLAPPIKTYEQVLIGLMFLLLTLYGGLIGGICGLVAMRFNFIIFRKNVSPFQKYFLFVLVVVLSWLIYFAIVFLLVREFGFGRRPR